MKTTTADPPIVDTRLARLEAKLTRVQAQGGTGKIVYSDKVPPFLLFTMVEDPIQAAVHFFSNN